jgi:hypothetical protein
VGNAAHTATAFAFSAYSSIWSKFMSRYIFWPSAFNHAHIGGVLLDRRMRPRREAKSPRANHFVWEFPHANPARGLVSGHGRPYPQGLRMELH